MVCWCKFLDWLVVFSVLVGGLLGSLGPGATMLFKPFGSVYCTGFPPHIPIQIDPVGLPDRIAAEPACW